MPTARIFLPAGSYDDSINGSPGAVATLTAGSIVETTPTVGDTLTVTGSNAPAGTETYLWQVDTGSGFGAAGGTNNAATYDTTGQPVGDYRRGVSVPEQAMVYTAAVTVAAAGFDPATLFTAGRDGFWVAPSLTTSFESADTSDPAEVLDPVQLQLDSSGLAVPRNLSRVTLSERPTLQLEGSDYFLRFVRASGQELGTASYTAVNATNGVSIFARVRFTTLDAGNIIAADAGAARLWQFKVQPTGAIEATGFMTGSTVRTALTATGLVTTGVWYNVCMVWNTTNLRVWVGSMLDADVDATTTNTAGTVNTTAGAVYMGARNTGDEPFNGDIAYGFVGNWSLSEADRLNLVTAVGGA